MAGHEKLFCHDCYTLFELAWTNTDADEDLVNYFESVEFCPFCGSQDVDDPMYIKLENDSP